MDSQILEWGPERLGELAVLCSLALADESLLVDDLELICRDGVTLGTADGDAAAVVTRRGTDLAAHLQLVVVHPGRRRRGSGRQLVHAAEDWAGVQGAVRLSLDGSMPFTLFQGVDTRWTEALCLFDSLGYSSAGIAVELTCPTLQRPRRAHPAGTSVVHVASDAELAQLVQFVADTAPHRAEEFSRAGESGTALFAVDVRSGTVLGALAHSVSRIGVVGPLYVAPADRGRGIGGALLVTALADLSTAGLRTAEISDGSALGFHVRVAAARVGRVSQQYRRELRLRSEG